MRLTSLLAAFAAGTAAMYYLDPEAGARRRGALRDFLAAAVGRGRPVVPHARLRRRTYGFHPRPEADPHGDAILRDRVRERVGRLATRPGAIHVRVENGVVRLSGDVLAQERDALLLQVREIPGVRQLVNALTAHDSPAALTGLRAREEAAAA